MANILYYVILQNYYMLVCLSLFAFVALFVFFSRMAAFVGGAGMCGFGVPEEKFFPNSVDTGEGSTNQDMLDKKNSSPPVPRKENNIQHPPSMFFQTYH